jgi:hypothetical protein
VAARSIDVYAFVHWRFPLPLNSSIVACPG